MSWTQFAFQNLPSNKKKKLPHIDSSSSPRLLAHSKVITVSSSTWVKFSWVTASEVTVFFCSVHFFQHKNLDADILQLTMCMAWESKKNITQLRFEVFEVHCWIHLVKKPNRLFKDRQLTMTNDGDLLEVCFTMPSGCLFFLPVPNNPSAVATCASKSINLAFKRSIHLSCHDHCTQ